MNKNKNNYENFKKNHFFHEKKTFFIFLSNLNYVYLDLFRSKSPLIVKSVSIVTFFSLAYRFLFNFIGELWEIFDFLLSYF